MKSIMPMDSTYLLMIKILPSVTYISAPAQVQFYILGLGYKLIVQAATVVE